MYDVRNFLPNTNMANTNMETPTSAEAPRNRTEVAIENAQSALQNYDNNAIDDQILAADRLGVNQLVSDVTAANYLLREGIRQVRRNAITATELDALTTRMNGLVKQFTAAVRTAEGAAPETGKRLEAARASAETAILDYERRGIDEQIPAADRLGENQLVSDVTSAHYLLRTGLTNRISATEIEARTTRLARLVKQFTAAVRTAEGRTPEVTKKRMETARKNAESAISNYDLRAVGEQTVAAGRLGVSDRLCSEVLAANYLLREGLRNGISATELEALTTRMTTVIGQFNKAVRRAEEERKESRLLDDLGRQLA